MSPPHPDSPAVTRLSVNVDHVATLRQARGAAYPDPVEAAVIAEDAGAHGITVHLRGDRRHVQDADLHRLSGAVRGKLNLEIAATAEMVSIAREVGPHQVTLVPERPDEVTTEGGLDLVARRDDVRRAAGELRRAGIAVSLFLDPAPAGGAASSIEALRRLAGDLPRELVSGVEINTDAYSVATAVDAFGRITGHEDTVHQELDRIERYAAALADIGLPVYAGHGLTSSNVSRVAAVDAIEELNIGHWLISRSIALGLAGAVGEMLAAMRGARSGG